MSGAPFTEWSVVARRTSATSTPPSATDPPMLDPFAMRPSSWLWGGQGEGAAGVPARPIGPARAGGACVKRRRSGRFTRRHAERIADAVPLHAPPERDARDAERGGGALPVPAMLVEHAHDARALVDHQAGRGRLAPREQLGQLHALRAGKDEERLEHVLELAHVAGPGVLEERAERAGRREREGRALRAVEARDEVLDERREVVAPLSKRRERDREHAQPIVQIAAELARLDHAPEVAVRGGDDADVEPPHAGGAERPHLAVLHDAQELRLERGHEVLDLVEEERAAIGELQHARALLHRAGEGAARVSEELALGERLGDGGAVDREKGDSCRGPVRSASARSSSPRAGRGFPTCRSTPR